jgi:hypothetical protein
VEYRSRLWLTIAITLIAWLPAARADVLHLELGAANYGAAMGNGTHRFAVLDQTLEELVRTHGTSGTVYLCDKSVSGLELATTHARGWLTARGLGGISVVPLQGDYNLMPLPKVKTAHLTNPGGDQLPSERWPAEINREILRGLERIMSISETGLRISSYMHPQMEFLGRELPPGVLVDTKRPGPEYWHPQGEKLSYLNDPSADPSRIYQMAWPEELLCMRRNLETAAEKPGLSSSEP